LTYPSRTLPQWRGSLTQRAELLAALDNNCTCTIDRGVRTDVCAAHLILIEDQRTLDGLLFAREIADQLRDEEFAILSRA
jgi:hypothetical protein